MTKILKIDYAPYTLYAKQAPNSKSAKLERFGALLRFCFKDFGYGYADCHPLEEFGDRVIHEQISLLKNKKFTNITQRSLYFATIDARSRSMQQSVFDKGMKCPTNHFTSPALIKKEDLLEKKSEGFSKFKFKLGRHIPNEINYIKDMAQFFRDNKFMMRLDYNGNLTQEKILKSLIPYQDIIDYIEDPFLKLDFEQVGSLKKYSENFKFAMDFVTSEDHECFNKFTYKVIKSARENFNKCKFKPKSNFIFTSSMDHPLGIISALFEYHKYQKQMNQDMREKSEELTCGLITSHLFESNKYSENLNIQNSILYPSDGFGFGFDALLRNEKWRGCS